MKVRKNEPSCMSCCTGLVQKAGKPLAWTQTVASELGLVAPPGISSTQQTGVRSPMRVMAANGDWCDRNAWVLISSESGVDVRPQLGLVKEVLQGVASSAESRGMADWIIVQRATVGTPHDLYHMPQVSLLADYTVVRPDVRHPLSHVSLFICMSLNTCLVSAGHSRDGQCAAQLS